MPSDKHFNIEVASEDRPFSVDEIWPDGDAPENPTVEDVIEVIRQSRGPSRFISDWSIDLYVEVDGKNVF